MPCGIVTTCPTKKRRKAMPSSLIAHIMFHPIMTSVALVVLDVAMLRCCRAAELRSAKISSLKTRIRQQRCKQQQPHKTLVNNGSCGSDGADLATSDGWWRLGDKKVEKMSVGRQHAKKSKSQKYRKNLSARNGRNRGIKMVALSYKGLGPDRLSYFL